MLLFALWAAFAIDVSTLNDGDLLFQHHLAPQSTAIAEAQSDNATHVGIAVKKDDAWFVLEAVGPVKWTPLASFVDHGKNDAVVVMHDPRLTDDQRAQLIAAAQKDLGKPYDLFFTNDDSSIYCSELVARAYATIGVDIGKHQQGKELQMHGPAVEKLLDARWRKHPLCRREKSRAACASIVDEQDIVTPASLLHDPRLVRVFGEELP
jgi:Permuted papain-like amidase enzyme, YaeF/YiiX, C92 family